MIEDNTDPPVPEELIASAVKAEETQDTCRVHKINHDEPLATLNYQEVHHNPSLLSDHRHYTAANVQDGTFSITSTSQGDNNTSLGTSSQGRVESQRHPTEELISPPRLYVDPNNQSLPLLEATLAQDALDEPVYDAFRLNDVQRLAG